MKERVAFDGTEEEKYKIKDLFKFLFTKPVIVTFLASLLYLWDIRGAAGQYLLLPILWAIFH